VFYAPDRTIVLAMRKHFCSLKCVSHWEADVEAGRRKGNLVPGGEIPAHNAPDLGPKDVIDTQFKGPRCSGD
jgi:hypothetical protein